MGITETKIYAYLTKRKNSFYCERIDNIAAYAQSFLSRIPAMFSNYTNHDIGHSARVADYMVDLLPRPLNKYNDTELVIMLCSAIFHDIGMVVSETEGDLTPAKQDDIRKTHHIRSEKFLNDHNEKYDCFNIDNEGSVNFKNLVATIARSHGEDFSWIEKNLKQKEYFGNDTVNPRFIACLLRLGDYLDFDSKRTPYHLFNFLNLSTISSDEWKKHFSITNYNKIENQRIVFYGNCEEPDIFLGILHYFNLIEKEIKNAKSLLSNDDEKYRLTIEDKVLNQISHNSFDSVDLQFLMDYISISNLLMGENLYSDKKSALREIIQNSMDAVSLRKEIAEKNEIAYTPEIKIVIEEDKVSIQDNGIGMTLSDVKNYFLNIGHSFYRSADFKDLSLTYKPISHYGIGFLSSFLLSDSISVKTTSYKEPKVCNVLRLQKNNRFVIQKSEENALPEAGTEIILAKSSFMKVFPKVEDIRKYISETFKDTGIKIIVSEDGQENAVSFTNQQTKNRIDISEYLNNVECCFGGSLTLSLKDNFRFIVIQPDSVPFENTGEYIYDAEYFPDMIIDSEVLDIWSKETNSSYSINRLLNSESKLQFFDIYPLDDDEIESFLQAQEITDDNEVAYDYLQKKHSINEPIRIYIADEYLFYDIDDYDFIDMEVEIKGYGETSKFKKLLREFIEKEVGVDVPACLIRTKLQPIYIYDEHFSRIEHKRTVSSFYHSNLFVKNVRIPNFSISIPVLIRPLMLANFEINIFSENCYPDVSRTSLKEETCRLLGYAIGRAIHIYILKQANLKAHEKKFLSAFINKYYKYDPNNEFCKKTK